MTTLTDALPDLGLETFYDDDLVAIVHGDALEILSSLSGASAIVTDPPYELGFMGKSWDSQGVSFQKETWEAIRRACLPGAPILAFGGSRTQHRIACAIEDAGWTLRDVLMWVYGSGFPKSHNLSGSIDKLKGYPDRGHRIATANRNHPDGTLEPNGELLPPYGANSPEAQLWDGWGTGLKPAYEPIILGMNPLDGTFANNALKHGVAGINVDGCRVPTNGEQPSGSAKRVFAGNQYTDAKVYGENTHTPLAGRFPANLIHDGSEEVLELFPESKSSSDPLRFQKTSGGAFSKRYGNQVAVGGDSGSAARFFYCAKASRKERGEGNDWPTVKPLTLMKYLLTLVRMPERNLILDPFMGSGSTLVVCAELGIPCIGIDSDEHACEIAAARCVDAAVGRLRDRSNGQGGNGQ